MGNGVAGLGAKRVLDVSFVLHRGGRGLNGGGSDAVRHGLFASSK
jgi:hypothetical protein